MDENKLIKAGLCAAKHWVLISERTTVRHVPTGTMKWTTPYVPMSGSVRDFYRIKPRYTRFQEETVQLEAFRFENGDILYMGYGAIYDILVFWVSEDEE